MFTYILRRLLAAIPVLFGVSLLTFGLVRFIPGDPIITMLGPDAIAGGADVEGIRALYGLDRPWPVQYVEWLGRALTGDLGTSIRSKVPVVTTMGQFMPVTLQLTLYSFILGIALGLPLAIVAASNRGKLADTLAGVVSLLGISVPGFWVAMVLALLFSVYFRWLPSLGYVSITESPIEHMRRMILPSIGLALPLGATIMRFTRSSLLDVFSQDFVRTARAKGLGWFTTVMRHAVRNALIPVITVAGIQLGRLLGGAVIVEQIFALPGIGRYVFDGISQRDYPVVQGAVLLFTVAFILVNVLVDTLYGVVDPRVKVARAKA